MTMVNEVNVGGLWCSEVLDRLSDYLDGDLPPGPRDQVEQHLRGCDGCARFGGEFRATVEALRGQLLRRAAMPLRVREQLRRALDGEPGGGTGPSRP
jgi:anti-sigma factor RsiW